MATTNGFNAIDTAFLAPPRCMAKRFDDAAYVKFIHFFWETAMERFANGRWSDSWEPIAGIGFSTAAEMGDLAHQRAVICVKALRKLLQMWNDGVRANIKLTKNIRRIHVHVRRSAEHGKCNSPSRLFLVIKLVGLSRKATDLETTCVACTHYPIL